MHSEFCPAREFTTKLGNRSTIDRNIELKLCVLVGNEDKVLLTRTTDHISFFPKKWVLPEDDLLTNEPLNHTAARILNSQLNVPLMQFEVSPFMLYEEVVPYKLEWGLPRRQRLLLFVRADLRDLHVDRVNGGKIDYAIWIGKEHLFDSKTANVESVGDNIRIDKSQWASIAPNKVGEGIAEGHLNALKRHFA